MTRSRRSRHPSEPIGFRRGRRVADSMTPEYHAFLESACAAERVGDAATALEYWRGIPLFRRSPHLRILTQLAGLADELTPWMWARWAAYQCTRAELDGDGRSADVMRAALGYTVDMFHAGWLHDAYVEGDDPVRVLALVTGEDWAFHQICTHELEGLELFLDHLAGGALLDHSDLARQWVGARMGGFRVEPGPGLTVYDATRDECVELLDLGAGVGNAERWVIGRLMPSGTTPALMFDTRPLRVDEQTAREVAAGSGRGEWVGPLEKAIAAGRLGRDVLRSKDRALVTDVASRSLIKAGTLRGDLERVLRQHREGRDEVGRAAFRVLRAVAEGWFGGDERAPYVTAAVLDAHAHEEARRQLVAPGRADHWLRWAELVPEPARGRLQQLAQACGSSAA